MNLWQKAKGVAFTVSRGLIGSIDYPDAYTEAYAATKNQIVDHLSKAAEVKTYLKSISHKKKLSSKMRSAYKQIKLNSDASASSKELSQINEIKALIKTLVE